MREELRNIAKVLKAKQSFIVASHQNPDGDAMGSSLGLGLALMEMGKQVTFYNRDGVPENLHFLPKSDLVMKTIPAENYDLGIICDCADKTRVSEDFAKFQGIKEWMIVDHHETSQKIADYNLIIPTAAASGEVVYRVLKEMHVPFTPEIATNLYCAFVVDTGSFRYSNTNAEVLTMAADLVEHGADPWYVSRHLYENFPVTRVKVLAEVLKSLEIRREGSVAAILISQKMLKETGADLEVTEEFINYARSIQGVEVAVKFREIDPTHYRMSLRSKGKVDVSKIAAKFNGGGHKYAAGFSLDGSLEEVKKKVYAFVDQALSLKS